MAASRVSYDGENSAVGALVAEYVALMIEVKSKGEIISQTLDTYKDGADYTLLEAELSQAAGDGTKLYARVTGAHALLDVANFGALYDIFQG